MTKAQHTKGPWNHNGSDREQLNVFAGKKVIARTDTAFDDDKANARLIAAAPDMDEVIDEVITHLMQRCADTKENRTLLVKLCAVQAKARGGQ